MRSESPPAADLAPYDAPGRIEAFRTRLPRPAGPWLATLEAALAVDGRLPLRWAVTAAEGHELVIEGARWVPCSLPST